MNPEIQQLINKQVGAMPPKVREAFLHIDASKYIGTLAKKHDLRTDQAGVLENEIMIIMLGLENPRTFMNNLTQKGNISRDTAAAIVEDINRDVFDKIRHDLATFLEQSEKQYGPGEPEKTDSPAPAVIMPQPQTAPTTPVAPVITPAAPTSPTAPAQGSGARTLNTDFAKERMERQFRMPTETKQVTEKPVSGEEGKKYPGVDPYREPTK